MLLQVFARVKLFAAGLAPSQHLVHAHQVVSLEGGLTDIMPVTV